MNLWLDFAITVLTGLTIAIPLIFKLIEYVKKLIKEKNWNSLLNMIMDYMATAEKKFSDGATRKEWVMAMVEASSKNINYDVDMKIISSLIDNLCDMTKVINNEVKNCR
ncbi:MAG: hypothetical protein E7635_07645 [Ruminococcaceae bacterium]|nr:hypothetical protein [Oscillospiraceae bacterium]